MSLRKTETGNKKNDKQKDRIYKMDKKQCKNILIQDFVYIPLMGGRSKCDKLMYNYNDYIILIKEKSLEDIFMDLIKS